MDSGTAADQPVCRTVIICAGCTSGQNAVFDETILVYQHSDALAGRQLVARMHLGNDFWAVTIQGRVSGSLNLSHQLLFHVPPCSLDP